MNRTDKEVFQEHITAHFILRNKNFADFVRYIKGVFNKNLEYRRQPGGLLCAPLSPNLQPFPTWTRSFGLHTKD